MDEAEGGCCGCVFRTGDIPKTTKRVGLIAIALHLVGFLVGHVPFFAVNFKSPQDCVKDKCTVTNSAGSVGWSAMRCGIKETAASSYNWTNSYSCLSAEECLGDPYIYEQCTNRNLDGFAIFVAVPTVIIWLLGCVGSVLLLPGICGGDGCAVSCRLCAVIGLCITAAVLHGIIAFVEGIIFWVSGLTGNADWVSGLLLLKNLMCLGAEVTAAVVACGCKNGLQVQQDRRRMANQGTGGGSMMMMQPMQVAAVAQPVVAQPVAQPVVAQPVLAADVQPVIPTAVPSHVPSKV